MLKVVGDAADLRRVGALRIATPASSTAPAPWPFRPDIAGLRGLAVALVVLYHAGVPGLTGGFVGVDVFFVVSGFLMTTLLLREQASTGTLRIPAFYARRARRLLPMAVVVLGSTLLAVRFLVPPLLWPDVSHVARAAAVGLTNEQLARDGVDYLASDAPSPLQHYWSLAVEEQFYVLFPVLVLILAGRGRRVTTVALGVLTASSFAFCLWRVGRVAPAAFFGLPSRAWELGVGALAALILLAGHRPRRYGDAVSWTGIGVVVAAAVVIGPDVPFPGWATLAPVLGTAAALIGGASAAGPFLLRCRPARWVGRVSYSLYLWHWPLLVLPVLVTGDALGPWERGVLVGVALALAALSERWIERPFRRNTPGLRVWPTLGLSAVAVAATLVASVGLARLPVLSVTTEVPALTAATTGVGGAVVPADVTPTLLSVAGDLPDVYRDGCQLTFFDTTLRPCRYGDPSAARTVMLLGDSHAAQWSPGLERAAADGGWALTSLTKSSCPMVDVAVRSEKLVRPYTECETWKQEVLARMWAERPALVVLSAFSAAYRPLVIGGGDVEQRWADAEASMIRRFPPGTRVVVLGDSPAWSRAPSICLSDHLADAARCAGPPATLIDAGMTAAEARGAQEVGARYLPTLRWLCAATCPAIEGNVLVYRDDRHVTATFSRLLAGRLGDEVLGP